MRLENAFSVPSAPARVWPMLLDVPAVAPCLPGAELTEVVGERAYKGRARVRVGPMLLTFAGTAEIVEIDEEGRRARVRARGADEKGRGSAQADITFSLTPEGEGTRVAVVTELDLAGAVAQYGRASGLLQGIAAQITDEFARNFEAMIRARQAGEAQAAPAQAARPISGLTVLWRALLSLIRGWASAFAARLSRSRN